MNARPATWGARWRSRHARSTSTSGAIAEPYAAVAMKPPPVSSSRGNPTTNWGLAATSPDNALAAGTPYSPRLWSDGGLAFVAVVEVTGVPYSVRTTADRVGVTTALTAT